MGFFDSIGDAFSGAFNNIVKPVAGYVGDIGKIGIGTWSGAVGNLTGGVGQGIGGLGQGLGQIGKGMGDIIANPVFLLAIGGIVLLVVLKK